MTMPAALQDLSLPVIASPMFIASGPALVPAQGKAGTCSGDSGGPIFVEGTDVVAAVTSFGMNERCAGTGGGYRVDTADDLQWLEEQFGLVPGGNG